MVKALKYSYVILTVIILIMLAIGSIVSPALFSSIGYTIIYFLYAALTLVSVLFVPGILTKLFHFMLALLIIVVVFVKSNNDRYPLTFAEGGNYQLVCERDTLTLELLNFTIRHENGSASAVHYESRIIIDSRDTISVTVNHPFKHERTRLYQSSYRSITPFNFYSIDSLRLFEGQYAKLNGIDLHFLEYDPVLQRVAVRYNEILFYLPVGRKTAFLDSEIMILPDSPEMATVLEYVEVKGHVLLLLTALLLLLTLIISRLRRR